MRKLVYFTNSFPYGIGEDWKYTELSVLQEYFDEVLVAPLAFNGSKIARVLPDSIKVLSPLFESDGLKSDWRSAAKVILRRLSDFRVVVDEMKSIKCSEHLKMLVVDLVKADRILSSDRFTSVVLPEMNGAYLYFFWGKGYADILPFTSLGNSKVVVRVHGFDLYGDRNFGYIPLQRAILERADNIATVSKHGQEYLLNQYPRFRDKLAFSPLGSKKAKRSNIPSSDGLFRIVSCSFVSPVKRLHLIPMALAGMTIKVFWTHIGGGEGLDLLKLACNELPDNIRVHFEGNVLPSEILKIYEDRNFDMFLNVSVHEGLPVSIMEAMSAGIPVLATNVGGTNEIVDDQVGWLLPQDLSASELTEQLKRFADLPPEIKRVFRRNCRSRHANTMDSIQLAHRFVDMVFH